MSILGCHRLELLGAPGRVHLHLDRQATCAPASERYLRREVDRAAHPLAQLDLLCRRINGLDALITSQMP